MRSKPRWKQKTEHMAEQPYTAAEMKAYHGRVIDEFRANGGKVGGPMAPQLSS